MRENKQGLLSDAAFVLMLVLLFVCAVYYSMYPSIENMVIFIVVCAVMIVTHFT